MELIPPFLTMSATVLELLHYFVITESLTKVAYIFIIQDDETPLTLASDKGYAVLADLIIEKTPAEKRKLLVDYKKKVSR